MGASNTGNQRISTEWKQPGTSERMNWLFEGILKPGLYQPIVLTADRTPDPDQVYINKTQNGILGWAALVQTIRGLVKIKFLQDTNLTDTGAAADPVIPTLAKPWIVLRYTPTNATVYADILSVSAAEISPTYDIILAYCNLDSEGVLNTDTPFDYSRQQVTALGRINLDQGEFLVTANTTPDDEVLVAGGTVVYDGQERTLASASFTDFGTLSSGYGRKDYICIGYNATKTAVEFQHVLGTAVTPAANAVLPALGQHQYPIAWVYYQTTGVIKGSDIHQLAVDSHIRVTDPNQILSILPDGGGNLLGTGSNSTSLGEAAVASATYTIAVGPSASASALNAIAMGESASATGAESIATGPAATASATYAMSFGSGSSASAENAISMGYGASASSIDALSAGSGAVASGLEAVSIGPAATASATDTTSIGSGASASHASSTALGAGATTTEANQVRLGTAAETVSAPGKLTIGSSPTASGKIAIKQGTDTFTDGISLQRSSTAGTWAMLAGSNDSFFLSRSADGVSWGSETTMMEVINDQTIKPYGGYRSADGSVGSTFYHRQSNISSNITTCNLVGSWGPGSGDGTHIGGAAPVTLHIVGMHIMANVMVGRRLYCEDFEYGGNSNINSHTATDGSGLMTIYFDENWIANGVIVNEETSIYVSCSYASDNLLYFKNGILTDATHNVYATW